LNKEASTVHISAVNLGEVYDILHPAPSPRPAAAQEGEATIFQQPNVQVVEAGWSRVRAAAELKAEGGLSFADAFAASLARELAAPLVTGDPEFAGLEQRGVIRVLWLPRQ
jgi:predicted nucleic acid-binding protein